MYMSSSNVVIKGNLVYLNVSGSWYVYDKAQSPIGSGAMGTVYHGSMVGTNIPVAIKKVKDEYANDKSIRERARQEASLMFRHRNLVEMLGLCESNSGTGPIYIVSKYVRGENLDKFVKDKLFMLPREKRTKTICYMILPIFDALNYLHSNKILHMDIKPSNIMVENGCNIRLMDLGIANIDRYTFATNSIMGTPKYAAPEQFGERGSKQSLDYRTDMYELSVSIYELLCGENPFLCNSFDDLIDRHKTLVLPYNERIPKMIIDVLRKAAHPLKSERYNNINEFRNAFKNAIINIKPESQKTKYSNQIFYILLITFCSIIFFALILAIIHIL